MIEDTTPSPERNPKSRQTSLFLVLSALNLIVLPGYMDVSIILDGTDQFGVGLALVVVYCSPITIPVLVTTIVVWIRLRHTRSMQWWIAGWILLLFLSYGLLTALVALVR